MMEPKFKAGDVVRCKVGGPKMIAGAIFNPYANQGAIVMPGQFIQYTCYWWNAMANQFQQWLFPKPHWKKMKEINNGARV
jgi:uncharacterized protein YodC (DUF2158 family)